MPTTPAQAMLEMIDKFLARTWDFDTFNDAFVTYLVEDADGALTDPEEEFFEAVHDKVDFTGVSPDSESRSYGWIDVEEFRSWLQGRRSQVNV